MVLEVWTLQLQGMAKGLAIECCMSRTTALCRLSEGGLEFPPETSHLSCTESGAKEETAGEAFFGHLLIQKDWSFGSSGE